MLVRSLATLAAATAAAIALAWTSDARAAAWSWPVDGHVVQGFRFGASAKTKREEREARRQLGVAIDRLPDRERLVIALYYYEGLTFKEIGKVLTVSESRVYQLHTQAVLRMRGYLGRDQELFRS